MATLYFKVSSDWEQVVKLRQECEKLETQLKKMDSRSAPAATKTLETQLASTKQQMMGLVTEAAKAGAEIENGFKKKIYDASQTVNGLSEKIIAQRAVIKDIEFDVKRLGDAYRTALKNNPIGASGKLAEYNAARKALDEEKAALFGLTQQQAEARLSVKKLRDEYSLYKKEAGDTVEINNGLSLSWGKMLGIIGGATALKSLASQIVRVRGKFQSMQTAIETMVGKDVASGLMAQLKEMAKISPLTLTDMVNAENMMLGFNIQAEDTVRYLQALSDISMGDSVKFKSLTLAFSQMSAAGKLMGQDLNQMINAGFNPLQIIAEKTGKSISTLKDEMSKGAVSAEMVQQAFIDATSAGGKFYQMSENASKTINGQLSMMQDALDNAFNEMGQASEGVIMEGIQLTTTLIQNYETVGKVLVGLIATYGAYRTAVMLATIATSKHTIAEVALTNARVIARKAQLLLNAAMLTNPYVAVATVATALVATMWTLSDSTSSAAKATREYNQAKEEAGKKEEEHKRRIDELLTSSRDESLATLTRQKSLEELRKEYPKIFEQYDLEKLKLEDILNIKRQINEEDSKQKVEKTKNDYYSLKETVSNQQRYLTLYDNPELRKNMSDEDMNIWRMFAGKQSYVEVREQMQKDAKELKLLQRDVIADNIASYKANLKEFSEERLKVELQMAQSEASKRNGFNVGGIMVKGGDLAGIITSINNEIENRKPQTTYQQDLAVAKEDWEKAKKGYETLIKDQKATSEQVKKAREEMEAKEKAYKELGGDVDKKKQIKESSPFPKLEQSFAQDLQKRIDTAEQETTEAVNDMVQTMLNGLDAEQEAMYKYLQNYGTFRERQKAITEEYSKKIADAGGADTWQGKLLQKEMEKALSDLDLEKLKQGINWELVFGDLDKVSKESLTKVKQQLKDFKNSEEYKNMAVDQKKVIDEALNNIQTTLIDKGGLLADLPEQLNELAKAQEELAKAQEEYNEAMKSGTDVQKESATKKLNDAQKKQQNAQTNVQKSTDKTISNLVSLSNIITELGANSEMSLSQVGSLAKDVVNIFTEAGSKIGGIVGAAFSILDAISTQGLDGFIGNVFGNVFKAVGSIFETLTFGLIGNSESDPKLQEDIERLTISNQELEKAITNLSDKMDDASVADASSIYEMQKSNLEEEMKNTREMMVRSASASSSGFLGIGGHHSTIYKINHGMTAEDWKTISEAVGKSVTNANEFFNLTSEEMWNAANSATTEYAKLKELADDGYKDAAQFMDEYIEYWKQLEELEDAYREKLTDTSFDSIRDEFKNSLLDMESDAEDFTENFEKMMQQAVVESMMSDTYAKRLKDWYKSFADSMTDGTLTGTEQSNLKAQWDQMVSDALAERDAIMQAMGWDSSSSEQQSASSRGFETMSQDTADELNGRFTAVYESNLRIEAAEQQQTVAITELRGSISALTSQASNMYNIADETRTILANSYLELQQIRENTEDSAKYLKDIKADIAEVKRNTSRL